MDNSVDCLIIGGGPAGLTAAVYLARFKRRIALVDGGWSRAEWITLSHNIAGFPNGIAGSDYRDRLRQQAALYGCTLEKDYVLGLRVRDDGSFLADMAGRAIVAQTVLLATGVVENKPPIPHLADAVKRGIIRTCPICDGYESSDKRIAILGNGPHAAAEALFLRTYSSKLTLLLVTEEALPSATQDALAGAGIDVLHIGADAIEMQEYGVAASLPRMASHIASRWSIRLSARHRRTSLPRRWARGWTTPGGSS